MAVALVVAAVIAIVAVFTVWAFRIATRRTEPIRGAFGAAARRYIGEVPPGASRVERLSWFRQFQLKTSVPCYPVFIWVAIYYNATWSYVAAGVLIAWSLSGLASVTREIRRARHAEGAQQS